MSVISSTKTKRINPITLMIVSILAMTLVGGQILRTNMLTEGRTSLDAYLDGQVARPFAYRVLLPQIIRSIDAITPEVLASNLDHLGEQIAEYGMTGWKIQSGPDNKYPRAIVWLVVLLFASLIGYALVGASLYSITCKDRLWSGWIIALVLLLFLVPIIYKGLGHIYDFTVLFFTACLLWAMAAKRHILYLLIFAVSCLNKETTVLMSVAYATVFLRRMEFSRYAMMLAAQFVIFLAIYLSIRMAYEGNPGGGMEVHIYEQYGYYRSHLNNIYILAAFCMVVVLVLILLTFRWSEKPQFLRRAATMILPFIALFLYGATPGELRNLYEIVPLISLLILSSLESIYRVSKQRAVTGLID